MTRILPVAASVPAPEPVLTLNTEMLARLMPMFLWLDARGRIRAMGPTLARIVGQGPERAEGRISPAISPCAGPGASSPGARSR
ncbi:hypothetical protein ACTTAM_04830 [Rhodobacter capsulatus]|uniref:hypothetical protein n=1 Tax=Rhodobacter capsulatus TaxID=1061 RepID=UPI004027E851